MRIRSLSLSFLSATVKALIGKRWKLKGVLGVFLSPPAPRLAFFFHGWRNDRAFGILKVWRDPTVPESLPSFFTLYPEA